MPIGNPNYTSGPMSSEAKETAPGMAHFAGTGPSGKTCGDCVNRGYYRKRTPKFNERTNEWVEKSYKTAGCAKFNQLTGNHGPTIDTKLHACKYFEEKPREQPASQQRTAQARDRL